LPLFLICQYIGRRFPYCFSFPLVKAKNYLFVIFCLTKEKSWPPPLPPRGFFKKKNFFLDLPGGARYFVGNMVRKQFREARPVLLAGFPILFSADIFKSEIDG
jgi:hypothetical protein